MKYKPKFLILLIFTLFLLPCVYSSNAKIADEPGTIKLEADTSPPIIIFDTTLMTTEDIFQILVYDNVSNIERIDFVGTNMDPLFIANITFNVTWSYEDYGVIDPPLKESRETTTPPTDSNTAQANVSTDLFIWGQHPTIEVEAENKEGLISTASVTFCDSYECWGRGGGGEQIQDVVESSLDSTTGVPIIHFDATGYFCCGFLEIEIINNGAELDGDPIISFKEIVTGSRTEVAMYARLDTTAGYNYTAGFILNPDVDSECFEDCDECTCPDMTSLDIIPIILGIFVLSTIIIIKYKRKR